MRVAIALVSSAGQLSGVQRHGINVARCLLTCSEILEINLIAAPWQSEFIKDALDSHDSRMKIHFVPLVNSSLSRNLWFFAELPKLATELQADVVHLAYPMPLWRQRYRCPVVVTLHDCYPYDIPSNFGFPKVIFNRMVLRQCIRAAGAIACVSESTFVRLSVIDAEAANKKAAVICNPVDPPKTLIGDAPVWGKTPFILCVAQHRRNKNILLALRAFTMLLADGRLDVSTRLVVVGIEGPETRRIRRFIAKTGVNSNVILINGISEADLQWSYKHCLLLLAPSTIEGFGLPVAEGLVAGSKIVCSDIAAFRELGGKGCRYIALGPGEVERFASAACAAINEPTNLATPLPQLQLETIGAKYLRLYRGLTMQLGKDARGSLYPAAEKRHPLL